MLSQLHSVSLFTGAGGLDYGFEAAGFETSVALDIDTDCCATLRRNRDWPVIERDIASVTGHELLSVAGLTPGGVDLLIGGPPCQPFSKSRYWVSRNGGPLEDPRANTLREFMRCVEALQPTVFVLENVHGIRYSGQEEGFVLLGRLIEEINQKLGTRYQGTWKVINTVDFGVPQSRTRFFLVAHRDGLIFQFPKASHHAYDYAPPEQQRLLDLGTQLQYHVTAWDAIGDLDEPSNEDLKVRGKWADLLPTIPEGENYLWHTNHKGGLPLFGWRTRYWSFLLKLAKDRPSWTIQAQPGPAIGPFHWRNRLLSTQELARLQTFPDSIEFVGNRRSRQAQIGNAVPSLFAEVLARKIAEQFFRRSYTNDLILAVKPKRPIPPPEPVKPVPPKYLHFVGNHPDHPGTGKGPQGSKTLATDQVTPTK